MKIILWIFIKMCRITSYNVCYTKLLRYPVKDTPFEEFEEPAPALMKDLRAMTAEFLKPMEHCARCRADAAGLLGQDIKESTQMLRDFALKVPQSNKERKYVAVASMEGMLVNQHMGEAESLYIFKETPSGYRRNNFV